MQKKIIVMAIASAISTSAFADASLYGTIDAAVANVSGSGQKSDLLVISGGQSASRVGLNASEDLDGGVKAIVNLEYQLDTQTNSTLTKARQQLLGLSGSFGTVATGYLQTTGYDWENKYDPLAGSAVSSLQVANAGMLVGTIAGAARAPRALAYISPNMGGLTFAANYSTAVSPALGNLTVADTSAAAKSTAYLLSGTYASGPLSVGLVLAGLKGATTVAGAATTVSPDMSDLALGASFDAGAAKLYGTYQNSKTTPAAGTSTTNSALSMSVVLPVGADAAAVQFAKASVDSAIGSSLGATGFTLGYMHTMSKTTNMYVAYQSVKNDSNGSFFSADNNALANTINAAGAVTGTMAVGGSSSVLALGLRKKF